MITLTLIIFLKHIRVKHEVAARCRTAERHYVLILRCAAELHLEVADHLQIHHPIGSLLHDLKNNVEHFIIPQISIIRPMIYMHFL